MDGFTGFKTATAEELPDAVAVMDPFHVVRLAGDALDKCRRRVQQAIHGHRGMKNDPLYSARRTLHTGAGLLTDKQKDRLSALFAAEEHVQVEATWGIYQRMIAAYREEDRRRGRELMVQLIDSISHGVPKALTELITLGRTLKKRAADVLAYFDRPGTSNGPTALARANSHPRVVAVLDDISDWKPSPDATVTRSAAQPPGTPLYFAYSDGLWLQDDDDAAMTGVYAEPRDLPAAWNGPKTVAEVTASLRAARR